LTDRELLEAAAMAAGIEIERDGDAVFFYNEFRDVWVPLVDDGDALRLAVKMKMDVTIGQSVKVVCSTNEHGAARIVLPLGDDENAATRRAIVKVAAAIGEKMGDALPR
jgi:hypothetical protein